MAWLILIVAGLLEAGWAIGLKYTVGFTRLIPSVLTGLAIVASMYLLSVAVRTLSIGTWPQARGPSKRPSNAPVWERPSRSTARQLSSA